MKYLTVFFLLTQLLWGFYAPPATPGVVSTGQDNARPTNAAALFVTTLGQGEDRVVSDGTTANRAIIQIPGTRGNLAGQPVASWVGWVDVPTSNPSTNTHIAVISNTSTPDFGGSNRLQIGLRTGGEMEIAVVSPAGFLARTLGGFRAAYSGQRIWLEVRFSFGSGAPVVRVNGVDVTSGFGSSGSGTTVWLDSGFSYTFHVTGLNWPTGTAPLGSWINAHLTNAESDAWRTRGIIPAWVQWGGGVFTSTSQSTFGTGITASATSFAFASDTTARYVQYLPGTVSSRGRLFRVRGTINSYSGFCAIILANAGVFANNFGVLVSSSGSMATPAGYFYANAVGTGPFECVFADNGSTGNVAFEFQTSAGTNAWDVSDIRIETLGALSLPVVQAIPVLDDGTFTGNNNATLIGMTPVTRRMSWRMVGTTSTSGNQQFLGASVFGSRPSRIDSWTIVNAGTSRTVSLGNVSAGTQYASGITAATGVTEVTLATRLPSTANIFVNSNGTDQLRHVITGQVLDNN